jgi:hypothetical protein
MEEGSKITLTAWQMARHQFGGVRSSSTDVSLVLGLRSALAWACFNKAVAEYLHRSFQSNGILQPYNHSLEFCPMRPASS